MTTTTIKPDNLNRSGSFSTISHSGRIAQTDSVESLAAAGREEGNVLLIDKPLGWTSFDVVNRVRKAFQVKKAGHAGTLDPKATGLLIVCTGKKTKTIDEYAGLEKEYEGVMELGATTPSFDSETEVKERKDFSAITGEQVTRVLQSFIGRQLQVPPMYSAVKHNGKPLYKFARKGRIIERAPRAIVISEIEVQAVRLPFVHFRIVCSKGTYIRALADDCGKKLGCGAYLKQLRRTRIGDFHVADAIQIVPKESLRQDVVL
ncbi:MAG: tRNA pseudouridine(55) synthase TruB [Bacteroidota bacterium]|nr:tRNA pseudouridine(55) synthase TruB [Bacteroidota bacterium]